MRKVLLLAFLTVASASAAFGQAITDERRFEIFGGYSNLQAEGIPERSLSPTDPTFNERLFNDRTGLHGFNIEGTGYFTPVFGLTGDFSFNKQDREFATTTGRGSLDTRVINVLGGPTAKFNTNSRLEPFARALFGVANTKFEAENTTVLTTGEVITRFETNATDFAMALGGGLDVRVTDRWLVRAFQFDYNPVFLRDRSIDVLSQSGAIVPQTLEGQRQDNLRFSFGVVFR
jgi:opacity protein-like surface antigen